MDIEHLSKSQIVLLTLLVSFVTSIATGIVTVSLMDQAPPAIAQTVNRIVERTVEKAVPLGQAASTVVTTEKTVVVKESDLIVQAVEKITPSLVRMYSSSSEPEFLGLGIVVDENGSVVCDAMALGEGGDATLALADGTRLRAFVTSRNEETGTAILQPATTTADGKPVHFTPAVLSVARPTLGQTIVVLSGKSIPRIADGLVTALVPQGETAEAIVDTNVSSDFVMQGSPMIDTGGGLLGISTSVSRASSPGGFISSAVLIQPAQSEKKDSGATE